MAEGKDEHHNNNVLLCYFCYLAIDECATNKHNCHKDAICTDRTPLFTCTCKKWYRGDGKNCTRKYHFYFAISFYLRSKDLKIELSSSYRKRQASICG